MRDHRLYLTRSAAMISAAMYLFIRWMVTDESFLLTSIMLLTFPSGMVQLFYASKLTVILKSAPTWIKRGMDIYWVLALVFLMGLFGLSSNSVGSPDIFWLWLLIVPWVIATYQFCLVCKVARWHAKHRGFRKPGFLKTKRRFRSLRSRKLNNIQFTFNQ